MRLRQLLAPRRQQLQQQPQLRLQQLRPQLERPGQSKMLSTNRPAPHRDGSSLIQHAINRMQLKSKFDYNRC